MTGPRISEIAAKATGLRPDQIDRAVAEYRKAAVDLHSEPDWCAVMHMSGTAIAIAQFSAEGTGIYKQVESERIRGNWESATYFVFAGRTFETYSEAREAELLEITRTRPHVVGGTEA